MGRASQKATSKQARRLLSILPQHGDGNAQHAIGEADLEALRRADLVEPAAGGGLRLTTAGRSFLARHRATDAIDPFLAQHIAGAEVPMPEAPSRRITMDQAESPLAWLARRKGRNGEPLIAPEQLQAGERLRTEFTRAQLMPRVTANWSAAVAAGARDGGGPAAFTDAVIAARQRVRRALDEIGPEFGGLLLDVCCFLKGLEDVERERSWPPRSAKVVLQLGLDRLARHYGYQREAQGRAYAPLRIWVADGEAFTAAPADETGGF